MTNSVPLPPTWQVPKYQFGEVTASGIVTGMQYYPRSFEITQSPESEWHYVLVDDFNSEDTFELSEKAIETLTFEQTINGINIEIEYCLEKLYLLIEQLKIARKKHNAE